MISNNGYTWTDKDETLDIHEQLVAAGWTGFEPSCQRLVRKAQGAKHEPCGKTTAFAVITRAELGSKSRMGKMAFFALGNANNLATLEGLYILPGNDQTKPLVGRVIAVGAGRVSESGKRVPVGVKKGQRIIFHRYEGTEVRAAGQPALLLLESSDILAIVGAA